jgi:hypothetical protein
MSNKVSNSIQGRKTANDVFYTPLPVVLKAIEMCDITSDMTVLDPCKATGNFYNNFPDCKKEWCEITDGKDFFEYKERVDLVIGNPPFSLWDKWFEHTISITDKFCYVMCQHNLTDTRLRALQSKGYGLTKIHLLKVDWWYGMAYICLFEKGKDSIMSVEDKPICCDICNSRCKRGRGGNSPNVCTKFEV